MAMVNGAMNLVHTSYAPVDSLLEITEQILTSACASSKLTERVSPATSLPSSSSWLRMIPAGLLASTYLLVAAYADRPHCKMAGSTSFNASLHRAIEWGLRIDVHLTGHPFVPAHSCHCHQWARPAGGSRQESGSRLPPLPPQAIPIGKIQTLR